MQRKLVGKQDLYLHVSDPYPVCGTTAVDWLVPQLIGRSVAFGGLRRDLIES